VGITRRIQSTRPYPMSLRNPRTVTIVKPRDISKINLTYFRIYCSDQLILSGFSRNLIANFELQNAALLIDSDRVIIKANQKGSNCLLQSHSSDLKKHACFIQGDSSCRIFTTVKAPRGGPRYE
jgi:hypothetical protein